MHAIKLIRLNTHVPRPQMLQPSPLNLFSNCQFENLERFVALADEPFVGFGFAGRIGGHEEAGPEDVGFGVGGVGAAAV